MLIALAGKKLKLIASMLCICAMLFGCATTQHGDGIVIKKELYGVSSKKDTAPIKNRTVQGGSSGAIGGGAFAGFFGLLATGLSSGSAATALAAGAFGGVIGGAAGLIVGSSVGLIEYALNPSHSATWQYQVKSLNTDKIFTIKEQSTNVPLHSRVKVLETKGKIFIKKT
ncbi:MAG: hypothetical protein QNK11_09295 [Legionella sp.]|nr:hypothetical protein [Legionella sp.]